MGRFVDANEEESECKPCEREGFTNPSSWKCPFVSASEGESEAQQAFCNVKSPMRALSFHHFRIPHDHTASRAPSEHLLPFSLDFTLQECLSCEAPK